MTSSRGEGNSSEMAVDPQLHHHHKSSSEDVSVIMESIDAGGLEESKGTPGSKGEDDDANNSSISGTGDRTSPRGTNMSEVNSQLKMNEPTLERSKTERRQQSPLPAEQAARIFDEKFPIQKK
ncbi:hypothetical protein MKX03_025788, partial [Papaver bracteatum]